MHAYFGNTVLRGHYIGKDFFLKKNLHVSYDTYCVSREKHAFQKVKWPFVHEFGFFEMPFFFVDVKIFLKTYPPITL